MTWATATDADRGAPTTPVAHGRRLEPGCVDPVGDDHGSARDDTGIHIRVLRALRAGDHAGDEARGGRVAQPLEGRAGVLGVRSMQAGDDRNLGHEPRALQLEQQSQRLLLQRQDQVGAGDDCRRRAQFVRGERGRRLGTGRAIERRDADAGRDQLLVAQVICGALDRAFPACFVGQRQHRMLLSTLMQRRHDIGVEDARAAREEAFVKGEHTACLRHDPHTNKTAPESQPRGGKRSPPVTRA